MTLDDRATPGGYVIVVIAPDSFKGTIRASDTALALRDGWRSVRPDDTIHLAPMADGGEGTLDALALAIPDAARVPVQVTGPDNRAVQASWLLLPDRTGVVELASTSGIELLDGLAPLDAHTLGFGQAIAAALDSGVRRLVLAIGSSGSSDGGVGALTALGGAFLTAGGNRVALGARGLADLVQADMSSCRSLPTEGAMVLVDVTNPLIGASGAAPVYGPQKGASPDDIEFIDRGLRRLADLLGVDPTTPGSGAAGGVGYGLLAWGARLVPGAPTIASLIGLPDLAAAADLVITGEGSFDAQSAHGKVPAQVAGLGRPTYLVAGRIGAPTTDFRAAVALADLAGSGEAAMADPRRWLHAAAVALAGEMR